jgi:glucokinase
MQSAGSTAIGDLDSLLKTKMPALGIDLGGTKILAAPVVEGHLVCEPVREATPGSPDKILQKLIELISRFQKDYVLAGVGIATAGVVNPDTGEILGSTPNIPGWTGTKLKQILESKTMLPVHVENDANAAAYGEASAYNLKDKECVVLLTIGTGVGGGILMKGHLFRGEHFAAGECGHMRISLGNQRLCTCGLFDCWEAYVAGRGLVATGKEVISDKSKDQSSLVSKSKELTTEMIVTEAANGDLLAQKAMRIWHEHLCVGMASLANTLDPDCFILTGGMSKFIDLNLLSELFTDQTQPKTGATVQIRSSQLGILGGLIGAAHIVLDRIAV